MWRAVLLLVLTAAAPPPDRGEALRALVAQDLSLAVVGHRLAVANVSACTQRAPQVGLVLQDLAQFSGADRTAAARTFGLGEAPAVSAVVPGSVADQAGLRAGDAIVAIDGATIGAAPKRDGFQRIAQIDSALAAGPVVLTIRAAGAGAKTVALAGTPGCALRVQLVPARKPDAWRDGTIVSATDALMGFAADDNEIAAVVAHELAHIISNHRPENSISKRENRAQELEADRMSLALMQRAGFDPAAAIRFRTRFGARYGAGLLSDRTHPPTRERLRVMQAELTRLTQ